MSTPTRLYPVARGRVLAAALLFVAALAGVAGLAGALRHPPTVTPVPELPDAADPRDEIVCPPSPRHGDAVQVGSNELYDCPHTFDGHHVLFTGEVVGAILLRPEGAWVQLNDDAYAGQLGPLPAHREFRGGNSGVGVHLPRPLVEDIELVGGPTARGDVLTVAGTYHLSDREGGEAAVIRATGGEITRRGQRLALEPLRDRQVVGGLLGLLAAALVAGPWLAARRR